MISVMSSGVIPSTSWMICRKNLRQLAALTEGNSLNSLRGNGQLFSAISPQIGADLFCHLFAKYPTDGGQFPLAIFGFCVLLECRNTREG